MLVKFAQITAMSNPDNFFMTKRQNLPALPDVFTKNNYNKVIFIPLRLKQQIA